MLALALLLALQPPAAGGVVAKSLAPAGAFARPTGPGAFEPLADKAAIRADELLVALPGAALTNPAGTVQLTSRADLQGTSPLPILETAFAVRTPSSERVDLAVTLDRGRIDLLNLSQGPAVVEVAVARQTWRFTLDKSSRVALELVGRWPAGTAYKLNPPPGREPVVSVVAAVLAGTVELFDGTTTLGLSAPPGPALVSWTSAGGGRIAPTRLDRVPDWAADAPKLTPEQAARGKAAAAALEKLRTLRGSRPDTAVDEMLNSAVPEERRIGLIEAGAHDDLPRLAAAVSAAKDRETWDVAVLVLRHWLGRGAGQDKKLVDFATAARGFTLVQAETLVRLLNGFTPAELERPETFDVLTEYLRHDQPAIRNLAAWHLVRLAPAGKGIAFQPNASKDEFEKVYKQWKELIPAGKLPPKSR